LSKKGVGFRVPASIFLFQKRADLFIRRLFGISTRYFFGFGAAIFRPGESNVLKRIAG
jgi:hypothetical protein